MSNVKKPAAAHEALGEAIPMTFRGEEYDLLPTSEWPYEVLEHFEKGRVVAFLVGVLGEEQHERFKATKPKVADVNEFVRALQRALGISGN